MLKWNYNHIIMKDFINLIRELRFYRMKKSGNFKQMCGVLRSVFLTVHTDWAGS